MECFIDWVVDSLVGYLSDSVVISWKRRRGDGIKKKGEKTEKGKRTSEEKYKG